VQCRRFRKDLSFRGRRSCFGGALFIEMSGGLRTALFAAAAIGFLTALVRFCPLNAVIGRDSCPTP